MNARAARFNVLPPGSVMCGWCEGYEAKARKAEKDADGRFKLLLRALRQIAGVSQCADYCRNRPGHGDWGNTCTRCMAREALAEYRIQKGMS